MKSRHAIGMIIGSRGAWSVLLLALFMNTVILPGCAKDEDNGVAPTSGTVAPKTLAFGTVYTDSHKDMAFTITNTGGSEFSGTATISGTGFWFVAQSTTLKTHVTYTLQAGESKIFTVQFKPQTAGSFTGSVDTGNSACEDVQCSGTGIVRQNPQCLVSPTSISFGAVAVGDHLDMTFTITNTGNTTLNGTVTESCSQFSLIGTTTYTLSPGRSATVTVRFTPTACGTFTCTIVTGAPCANVSCSGVGGGSGCGLSPTALNFGDVACGGSSDKVVTITNTGCGRSSGCLSVVGGNSQFTVVGDTCYNLGPGESKAFTVRFQPAAAGSCACTVDTGNALCADVSCTGTGVCTPQCSVSPLTLNFGTVPVGGTSERTVSVTNTGPIPIDGRLSLTNPDFHLVGPTSYSLTPGQSKTFTVSFNPTGCGAFAGTIETGCGQYPRVSCTGTGGGSGCEVTPSIIDFGTVDLGSYRQHEVTITNTGCERLVGTFPETCSEHFRMVGDRNFNLAPGEWHTFWIRFEPTSGGNHTCTFMLDASACSNVTCTGTCRVKVIDYVFLRLHIYDDKGAQVYLYEIADGWNECQTTWDNAPAHYGSVLDSGERDSGWLAFTGSALRNLVQAWYSGTKPNCGFWLESYLSPGDPNQVRLHSSSVANPEWRPYLEVWWHYEGESTNYYTNIYTTDDTMINSCAGGDTFCDYTELGVGRGYSGCHWITVVRFDIGVL